MRNTYLLCTVASLVLSTPAFAATQVLDDDGANAAEQTQPTARPARKPAFNTGVARARDPLDTAISTSTIVETEITKISPRSLAELARLIPGIRAEAGNGEGGNSYTVRGLPLVSDGAKYIQLQENGLPVLEYGDVFNLGSDRLLRLDLNLAAVQAIRGGSASTFASSAPGGIINLIDKTGDVEGGSIQATAGLDYQSYRLDMDYGAHINDTLRFHIGGFYRSGEGPRATGYNAYHGGQVKFNMTKDFAGGYFRVYFKLLDDHVPNYYTAPLGVSGTNAKPTYSALPGFDAQKNTMSSRYFSTLPFLDSDNKLFTADVHEGVHLKNTALGFSTKIDLGEWTVTDNFRYSDVSGNEPTFSPIVTLPAAFTAAAFGGNGVRYVNGPNAGKTTIGGNGLLAANIYVIAHVNDMSNVTNDLRASRVWDLGGGKLTMTGGFYHADQKLDFDMNGTTYISDVVGGGKSALVDITLNGTPITQNGVLALGVPGYIGIKRAYDVSYNVNAPYGSLNFHKGRLALGGSLRYDYGAVRGSTLADTPESAGAYDLNRDGVPETLANFLPTTPADPVHYNYHYLSYSVSANFRLAEEFSLFARYSRGARAAADRILFTPAISSIDGGLTSKKAAYDPVRQLEGGFKYRSGDVTANLTGFLANVDETNTQINTNTNGDVQLELISRSYRAYGAEFEASWRRGRFSINGGATLTHAEITADPAHPEFVGNTPRHQAKLIYQLVPQYDQGQFAVGASIVGTTASYAQDENQLRLPAFTTVGAFALFRPASNVVLSVNATNLFDKLAVVNVTQGALPASGVVAAQTLNGRQVSASLRFNF
ncbi:TonB-dependent receptor domain-containing protein [Novosphingobium pentaromativorans]|uniref:TonB-dependent receptor n=1 Tax=Novosphingobium pentaromativorans US6-1 TaxID=1088721 RepID=G6EFU5_9SPHN|nr:TonB-dependent receptor [Novosphingobium pentaromativorans]AIT81792.1 TonB-dependent receptor [Novosphingobium pentaromativorans US6-1]EHJ59634.1 hypothetical protein NSU_3216 [Novosphingobium pentaromativorans US6-1]